MTEHNNIKEKGKTMDAVQKKQGEQYSFPYHFIPSFDGKNFKQHQSVAWGYEYLSYLDFIVGKIKSLNFESLLDVGCGDGRFLFELNKKVKNKNLEGVDYSENALAFARAFNDGLKFYQEDALAMTSVNKKFDVITLIEVLEHIHPENTNLLTEAVWHHLNNNGVLVITVPSYNTKINPKHYQHFSLAGLKKNLR